MKKLLIPIILVVLTLIIIYCGNNIKYQGDMTNKNPHENNDTLNKKIEKAFSVEITSDKDSFSSSDQPITFTPIIKGQYDEQLQFHWILESDDDIEGFVIPENGPQKEIINSGEPVELGVFAEVSWIEGAFVEFEINLQVEEKGTNTIITSDKVIIENHEGIYSIKE